LTLNPRFLDDPLLIALSSTDIVSLLSARVATRETGKAVVLNQIFFVVEQCNVPLSNAVSRVFGLGHAIGSGILFRRRYSHQLEQQYRTRRWHLGGRRD